MTHKRNPHATAPIMRKGGAHIKSKTGQRSQEKQSLEGEAEEYLEERKSDQTKKKHKK